MADRWVCRSEPEPGRGRLYWHILFRDHPQVQELAAAGQRRLSRFAGLHFTPRQWLHMTTLVAGFADEISAAEMGDMLARARDLLSAVGPVTVSFGKVLYHPQAVMLGVRPDGVLDPVLDGVRAATRLATGSEGTVEHLPWTPHLTLAYSTSVQPARPIIAALGRELPAREATIDRISLVSQVGPERLWNWRRIAEVSFGAAPRRMGDAKGTPGSRRGTRG